MKLFYGDEKGQQGSFALDRPKVTIGRSSECDIVLVDDRISRVHAFVESVAGQFLVQDAGSSNGTYLNGMRLRATTSCALREGDVLEIGSIRFLYGATAAEAVGATSAAPEVVGEISEGAFPLHDLLRDGADRATDLAQERTEFLRAFVGVSPVAGLERCLEVIGRRIAVDALGVYMKGPGDSLQPVAWLPGEDVARGLARIAQQAWSTGEGRLVRGFVGGADSAEIRDTVVRPVYSAGAVPFVDDADVVLGVLAVERVHEKRLDRVDLARLALMAETIARTLALGERSPSDTRLGVEPALDGTGVSEGDGARDDAASFDRRFA